MTSLSRRKRRITARAITRATLAVSAAALALVVGPLSAQPGQLPLPKGYQPRTPPAPAQPQPAARPAVSPTGGPLPGSVGQILYFNKPADAALANGANGQPVRPVDGVALNEPPLRAAEAPVPDVPPLPLPPPASRYLPPQGGLAPPPAVTVSLPQPVLAQPPLSAVQPGEVTSTSQKAIPPVPPEFVQLPTRASVFTVYDDRQLEAAIRDRVLRDNIASLEKQIQSATDPKTIDDLRARLARDKKTLLDPASDASYAFPELPVVSPPGVAYRPKTLDYAPRQVLIEPNYVVHRRLHFEERNAERSGWDLGPAQALLSTGYFWRDTLLWPQSLASACVRGPWDTSAGKAGAGCPSPYYLYPLGLTITGTAAETAILTGGAFLLP
jgi:hypothetical protein